MAQIPLGDLQFRNVSFDQEALAAALRDFVNRGSERNTVALSDLTIISRREEYPHGFSTVAEAIAAGTRLFDALAYFSLPVNLRPQVEVDALEPNAHDPSLEEISRSVFFVFFYVLSRGSPPPHVQEPGIQGVPNFLRSVMGLSDPPYEYVQRIASFDLRLMSHSWVKQIRILGLGQETQNRLALGVAGYRLPSALALAPIRQGLEPHIRAAVDSVIGFVRRGPVWDCFSATRTPQFLNRVQNLNANVGNLLLDAVDEDVLQQFVQRKILFAMPVRDPRHTEYQQWTAATFDGFVDFIFPAE